MTHIIETIGSWGVKTTDIRIRQFSGPQPGDAVVIPEGLDYPFNRPGLARVASKADLLSDEEKQVAICINASSVFLDENAGVSISGGPFTGIPVDDLIPNGLQVVSFWNWGDNPRGAGMGVDYRIVRPCWLYVPNLVELQQEENCAAQELAATGDYD